MAVVRHKEAIHSGHFMISEFEADAQDEAEISVPPQEEGSNIPVLMVHEDKDANGGPEIKHLTDTKLNSKLTREGGRVFTEVSLDILFQNMSVSYRQKLTSPKWNRFKGLKMKWKDKIRLNNVIWRCWHMQFIEGRSRLVCAFAHPLDIDNHSKTEGTTLLEGKYWKRKLQAITTEYKEWRLFYKNKVLVDESDTFTDEQWDCLFHTPFQMLEGSKDDVCLEALAPEEDFFIDALFNSLQSDSIKMSVGVTGTSTNQLSSGQMTPSMNLDDFLSDIDTSSWLNSNKLMNNSSTNADQQDIMMDLNQQPHLPPGTNEKKAIQDIDNQTVQGMMPFPMEIHPGPPANAAALHINPNSLNTFLEQPDGRNLPYLNNESSCQPRLSYPISPAEKRLLGPITCTSEKRHSPKHRILHHRDNNYPTNNSQTSKQNSSNYIAKNITHPYLVSSDHLNNTDQKPYQEQRRPKTLMEAEVNSNKYMQQIEASSPSNTTATSSRTIPYPLFLAPAPPQPAINVMPNGNCNNENLLEFVKSDQQASANAQVWSSRQFQRYCLIPPPPMSGAPQPKLERQGPAHKRKRSAASYLMDSPGQNKRKSGEDHAPFEQKRKVKNGFDLLRSLIPTLNSNNNMKISKAALLHKGGDYLQQLQCQSKQLAEEMAKNHKQIEQLQTSITALQNIMAHNTDLPDSSTNSLDLYQSMYDRHVECCTVQNWKYFMFACIMKPLLTSFHHSVSTSCLDEMNRSCLNWIDQNMSLPLLRRTVIESMKTLCTDTDILSEPEKLPEEAVTLAMEKMRTMKEQQVDNKYIYSNKANHYPSQMTRFS